MEKAKKVFDNKFSNKWSDNGPLCSSGYSNLMTNMVTHGNSPTICDSPLFTERLIVQGFNDPGPVIGIMYLLPESIDSGTLPNWVSKILRVKLDVASDFPNALLARLLQNQSPIEGKYLSIDGRFYVQLKVDELNRNEVSIYDLQALDIEKIAFDICLKDFQR